MTLTAERLAEIKELRSLIDTTGWAFSFEPKNDYADLRFIAAAQEKKECCMC